jgi:hypothetical protein
MLHCVMQAERSLHQPSPNRTEAAAAMMHLFSSSADSAPAGSKVGSSAGAGSLHWKLMR